MDERIGIKENEKLKKVIEVFKKLIYLRDYHKRKMLYTFDCCYDMSKEEYDSIMEVLGTNQKSSS